MYYILMNEGLKWSVNQVLLTTCFATEILIVALFPIRMWHSVNDGQMVVNVLNMQWTLVLFIFYIYLQVDWETFVIPTLLIW